MNKATKMLMLRGNRPEQAYTPYRPEPYMPAEQRRPIYAPIHITRQEYEFNDRAPMREPDRTAPQRRNDVEQRIPPYWEEPWRRDRESMPESAYRPMDGDEDWAEPYREPRTVGFGDRDDMESRRGRTKSGRFKRMSMGHTEQGEDWEESGHQMGHGRVMEMPHRMDEKTAREWTARMRNEDGSKGPHWTMEQTKQFAQQKSVDCDPLELWVTMNMMYSDYCTVAKKLQMNTVDFYLMLAQAFLDDRDAGEGKLAKYYECIVK